MPKVRIRPLVMADIPAVERIEKAITKAPRTGSLGRHVRDQLQRGDRKACLVGAIDDACAGFVVGDVRPWEFGEVRDVGWVKVVGVDPAFQGQGVGKALGEGALKYFKEK